MKPIETFLQTGCDWARIEFSFSHSDEDCGGNYHPDFYTVDLMNDRGFEDSGTFESFEKVIDFIRKNVKGCPECDCSLLTREYIGPMGQTELFCSRCDKEFLKRATDWNEVM